MSKLTTDVQKVWPRYLRAKTGWTDIQEVHITGETTQSWLEGTENWGKHVRWSKCKYTVASEAEYREQCWRDKHQYRISYIIGHQLNPFLLREIARMIGYREDETGSA